jgi:hypothetical protein
LQRIVPLEAGDAMSQFFTIKEPEACAFPNFKTIYSYRKLSPFTLGHAYDDDTTFLLHGEVRNPTIAHTHHCTHTHTHTTHHSPLTARQRRVQMVWCQGKQTICFACSPVLNSIEEARYFGIDMSDFPLCDQAQARLMTAHAAVRPSLFALPHPLKEKRTKAKVLQRAKRKERKAKETNLPFGCFRFIRELTFWLLSFYSLQAAYKPTDSESVAPEANGNCGGSTIVRDDKAERARGTSGSGRIFKTLFGPSPSKTRRNRGGDEEELWRTKCKPHSADGPAVTETCPLAGTIFLFSSTRDHDATFLTTLSYDDTTAMAPASGSFDSVSAIGRGPAKLPTIASFDSIPVTKGTKIRFPIGSEQGTKSHTTHTTRARAHARAHRRLQKAWTELISNERLRRGRTGSNTTAGARSAEGSPRQSLGSATSSSSSPAALSFECGAAPISRLSLAGAERLLHVFTETLLEDSWHDFPLMRTMLELDMASAAPRGHEHPLSEAIVSFYTIKGKSQHLLTSSFIDQIASSPRGAYQTCVFVCVRACVCVCGACVRVRVRVRVCVFLSCSLRAEESAVLFREESIAVRLFKAFIHQQAAHYIDYCIGNLITTVNALEKPLEVRLARHPTF